MYCLPPFIFVYSNSPYLNQSLITGIFLYSLDIDSLFQIIDSYSFVNELIYTNCLSGDASSHALPSP